MPKPGYTSFTIATWVLDLVKECTTPGDSPQDAIKDLVQEKLGRPVVKKAHNKWKRKFNGRN